MRMFVHGLAGILPAVYLAPALAQEAAHDAALAQRLSNPVSNLISVPFQFNFDSRIGPDDDGRRASLNIQPVVPIHINPEWNLISRTILPVISQWDIAPGTSHQFGPGDTLQSLFLTPRALLPTATDDLLGSGRWGMEPTAVVLRQSGRWTIGSLANHVWSVGGGTRSGTGNVGSTLMQPFIACTAPDVWTFRLDSESTHDWANARLVKIGEQRVSLFVGARHHAFSPEAGPKGFGSRAGATLLFPD